jgi:hypothetical protein
MPDHERIAEEGFRRLHELFGSPIEMNQHLTAGASV